MNKTHEFLAVESVTGLLKIVFYSINTRCFYVSSTTAYLNFKHYYYLMSVNMQASNYKELNINDHHIGFAQFPLLWTRL